MPKIDFDKKTFLLIGNSSKGKVNDQTIFEFYQDGNLVTADYSGGPIRQGKIIAELKNDSLDMLYQCMTTENELKAGKAIAKISFDPKGKMKLKLHWEWLDGSGEKGISEYLEN